MDERVTIEIASQIRPVLEQFEGKDLDQKIAHLLSSEIRRYLEECEREMLELEIKYGLDYEEFREKLAQGQLGDEFSYDLEQDAMRWGDLLMEKQHWLNQLRAVEALLR